MTYVRTTVIRQATRTELMLHACRVLGCYCCQCHACMSSSRVTLAHADNLIQTAPASSGAGRGMAWLPIFDMHVRCPAGRQDRSSTEQGPVTVRVRVPEPDS